MPLAFSTPNLPRRAGNVLIVTGTIVASGNYSTGGDTLDLSQIPGLPTDLAPDNVDIVSVATPNSGWEYGFVKGASLANGKMQVFGQQPTSASAGVIVLSELAAGAYPASITGDVISVILTFLNFGQ